MEKLTENEKKETRKIGLDRRVLSEDVYHVQETLVKAHNVSEIKKGLVRASDVERARKEIESSKTREGKKQ